MPKPPKKNQDTNTNAEQLVRAVTGVKKVRGESLLGSPEAKRMLREAKDKEAQLKQHQGRSSRR